MVLSSGFRSPRHESNEDLRHAKGLLRADPVLPSRSGRGEVFEAWRAHPEPWDPLVEPEAPGAGGIGRETGRRDETHPVPSLPDRTRVEDRQKARRCKESAPGITPH